MKFEVVIINDPTAEIAKVWIDLDEDGDPSIYVCKNGKTKKVGYISSRNDTLYYLSNDYIKCGINLCLSD